MGVRPIEFEEALSRSVGHRRHLLLGNGFSISVHSDFGYPKLYEKAVAADPSLKQFFPDPANPNFEEALALASDHIEAGQIRTALIKAVATVLPQRSLSLTDEQRRYCREFLGKFVGRHLSDAGAVFTTNYDLLLHWVVSSQPGSEGIKRQKPLQIHDGFDHIGDWHQWAATQAYYLHGAVHINQFYYKGDSGPNYTKMLRYQLGSTLKEQVDYQLSLGQFPVFVAEATADDKVFMQNRRSYLKHARKRFKDVCNEPDSALFTFGYSFGLSDNHISDTIAKGKIGVVYLGVFSDGDRRRAAALARTWSETRSAQGGRSIEVCEYDARSCPVWPPRKVA